MAVSEPQQARDVERRAASRSRPVLVALGILIVLAFAAAPLFKRTIRLDAPVAEKGVIDYAAWGPMTAPVRIRGEYLMTWRMPGPAYGAQAFQWIAGGWKGRTVGGVVLPEHGAASYEVTIRNLPPGDYTLFLPKIYAASRLTIDGRVRSVRGQLGLTPQTNRYLVRAASVPFYADGSPIHLRFDVAEFHHRDNGITESPMLALTPAMDEWIARDWLRSLLLATSLLLLALFALVVFAFRRTERSALWMVLGCASFAPQVALLGHDNLMQMAIPSLDFGAMLGTQFLASTAAISFVLAYAHELFPRESSRRMFWLLQAVNIARFLVYAGVWAFLDIAHMSVVSQWSVIVRTTIFLYILWVVALACWRRREGALVFLFGLGVFVAALIYTDVVNNTAVNGVADIDILSIGALMLLFSQIVIIAERWSLAIADAEQTNADLRRLLDVNISITSEMDLQALLTKIVGVTSKVIQADRTTLFLHEAKTDELWSVVAEGVAERQIRFPSSTGLAGWCFTRCEAVNLPDAYADPRFNPEVDAQTGYRTTSVLAVPVTARDGRCIGVMQALNRHSGPAFGAGDVERMSAFAAQAAIAIDNATLFSQVAAERNYNESILRSMSTGVITLDTEARVAKVNGAAARILEIPEPTLLGGGARAWLAANNPSIIAEIDAVSESGHPKQLIDADIRTGRGNMISVNVSIVPLVIDGARVGLLLLFEDITDEKRMEGAMRRFMSQEVVDQVMLHDELQFGVACRASVLFADLRNFTSLAETLQPRETVDMLNEVFTDLFEAVAGHGGTLDKFLGDAVMAVYGAPLPMGRDPLNAVESAVAMIRMVEALNARRAARGRSDLALGVGIATGEVVAGTIGSPKRMDYTVIGDSVNLAARLQQITKQYQVSIVICEETAAAVAADAPLRELDTIRVRGRSRPAKIFQVLLDQHPGLDAYRRGRELMNAQRWADAAEAFEAAIAADPDDRPAALMLERVRILAHQPPAPDWDGVWDSAEAA